ncbi:MAG: MgtC/SapB family protein [Clostridia bacterium]|nr:MgtC/SapB family protein [Clostridia bacterium]
MFDAFFVEYKYLLAIILSVVLGFLIGLERKTRAKEAGVRTHTIVCFGACLLMIISKYGFSNSSADVSRVASQIVSGIGFIGAGIIVYRKNAVHGLTTAAGVWATAGIGMACGAGLYFVAVGGTIIMICVQYILHINCKLFNLKRTYTIKISFVQTKDENRRIKEIFGVNHFHKLNVVRGEKTIFNVSIYTDNEVPSDVVDEIMKNNDFIISIERCDD